MKIASACLCGLRTRYDGKDSKDPEVVELLKKGEVIPLCPEQLGGLPTPREPVEFEGGDGEAVLRGEARVVGVRSRKDFTEELIRGAQEFLKVVKLLGIKKVIMKEGSPSCGLCWVMINGKWKKGMGITTALLKREGTEIESRGLPESLNKP